MTSPATGSTCGNIVGKECDYGADVLLTHHASCKKVCPLAGQRRPRHGL
jgi:hypothetical protein